MITRPGLRPLFPTPLSCLAARVVQQSSLQRLCQVSKLEKGNILLLLHIYTGGGSSFDLVHSGAYACGIPDGGDTIVLTGGYPDHKYVTRWVYHHHHHHKNNDNDDDHDFDNDNENEYFSIND